MNLAGLIASFATAATYTVTRTARGSISYGEIAAGTQTTLTIIASVVPASDKDLERLPEGRILAEARTLITATLLETGEQGGAYEADQVAIDGDAFEVSAHEIWTDPLSRASAYRYILTRVDT